MKDQYVLSIEPDQMRLHQDRRSLKNLYKQLRSSSARTVFRQLTNLYFQSMRKPVTRMSTIIGVCEISRHQLEYAQMFGERLQIRVVGLLAFSREVTAEMVEDCIQSISIFGWTFAEPSLRPVIRGKKQ